MYLETNRIDVLAPHVPHLPEPLEAYSRWENVDPYILKQDTLPEQLEQQSPLTSRLVRLSRTIDQALPDIWWKGVAAVQQLPLRTSHPQKDGTLSEKDAPIRTREQMALFLGEELTPIRHSSLQTLINALSESPSQKAKQILPLLAEYKEFSEQNISDLLDNIARIRLSGIALNAMLPIAANSNTSLALATSGIAIQLAKYHAESLANAYDTMNHYLRAGIENGAILEFDALQALGVPVSTALERFMDRSKRGELLLGSYPYIISLRAYTNSEPGLALGAAMSTALSGTIDPFVYGLVANRIKNTGGKIWETFRQKKSENFSAWFNSAQAEVTELANQAVFAENPQQYLEKIYSKSQDMLRYINKHGNLPAYEAEHRYAWIIQFISNAMSSTTAKALMAGATVKSVGLIPFLAMEKLGTDAKKAEANKVKADQANKTLHQIHENDETIYRSAAERYQRIQTNINKLDLTSPDQRLHLDTLVFHNGEERPADITLVDGYNFFVGDSGSGKSTAVEQLMTTCDSLNIPYGYSPVKMLNYLSAGSYLSKIISSNENVFYSHFAQYAINNDHQFFTNLFGGSNTTNFTSHFHTALQIWSQEWLQIHGRRGEANAHIFDDNRWSLASKELNKMLLQYLKDNFKIPNPEDVLLTNGSEGERKRLEICSAIDNKKAKFIFIDESFAHLDPKLLVELTNLVRTSTQYQIVKIVIVTHQPQTITQFMELNRGEKRQVSITSFKLNHKPTTQHIQSGATITEIVDIVEEYTTANFIADLNRLLTLLDSDEDYPSVRAQISDFADAILRFQQTYKKMPEQDRERIQQALTEVYSNFIKKIMAKSYTEQERYMLFEYMTSDIIQNFANNNQLVELLSTRVRALFAPEETDFLDDTHRYSLQTTMHQSKPNISEQKIKEQITSLTCQVIEHHALRILQSLNTNEEQAEDIVVLIENFVALYRTDKEIQPSYYQGLDTTLNGMMTAAISDLDRYYYYQVFKTQFEDANIQDETISLLLKKFQTILPSDDIYDYSEEPVRYSPSYINQDYTV